MLAFIYKHRIIWLIKKIKQTYFSALIKLRSIHRVHHRTWFAVYQDWIKKIVRTLPNIQQELINWNTEVVTSAHLAKFTKRLQNRDAVELIHWLFLEACHRRLYLLGHKPGNFVPLCRCVSKLDIPTYTAILRWQWYSPRNNIESDRSIVSFSFFSLCLLQIKWYSRRGCFICIVFANMEIEINVRHLPYIGLGLYQNTHIQIKKIDNHFNIIVASCCVWYNFIIQYMPYNMIRWVVCVQQLSLHWNVQCGIGKSIVVAHKRWRYGATVR